MNTPRLSLIYMTYRPGGIDLLAESLKHQPSDLYELVVIDDFPGRAKRGEARRYIENRSVPLAYYGPSKIHSLPRRRNGLANAMNSGALQASACYLVFVHDFVWLPPGAIAQWLASIAGLPSNTLVSGIASMRNSNDPTSEGDISIWDESYPECVRNIYEETEEWVPAQFENFYCGVPVEFLEIVNGIDERTDGGHISWPLESMVFQATCNGFNMAVDRRLRVVMANHRKWTHKNARLWHAEKMSDNGIGKFAYSEASPNPYNFKDFRNLTLEARYAVAIG